LLVKTRFFDKVKIAKLSVFVFLPAVAAFYARDFSIDKFDYYR